jgi:uncharacterized membrane protein YhiD involved in acid resistance
MIGVDRTVRAAGLRTTLLVCLPDAILMVQSQRAAGFECVPAFFHQLAQRGRIETAVAGIVISRNSSNKKKG